MKQIYVVTILLTLSLCSLSAQESRNTAPPPGTVTGSGTTNYIPAWTGSTSLGNSVMYQTGQGIGIGTTSPQWELDVAGHINTSGGYLIGENLVLNIPGGASNNNIAVGVGSIPTTSTGQFNTALGDDALGHVTTGTFNTAAGNSALWNITSGSGSTATGQSALIDNVDGSYNTADGAFTLEASTGSYNTATGYEALRYSATADANVADGYQALYNASGGYNTAVGFQALLRNTTGTGNVAIGNGAGAYASPTANDNIHIGNPGVSTDNATIRIGSPGSQTSFFAAGVRGVTTGENNAIAVVIDSNGQLGTISSSRRFKTDIQDMGEASRGLMRLRPVTFRYKKPFADGSQPIQYGLIAEEVAEVYPGLVAYGADGRPESVKYQVLDAMLLNELQQQKTEIHDLQEQINAMKSAMSAIHSTEVRPPQTVRSEISPATEPRGR